MKYRLHCIFFAILLPFDILASKSDYGRSFYTSDFSIIVGQIILVLIIGIILYLCVKHILGKGFCKSASDYKTKTRIHASDGQNSKNECPLCKGKLFIDLGQLSPSRRELSGIDPGEIEFYWDNNPDSPIQCARRVCPHCKGRGTI